MVQWLVAFPVRFTCEPKWAVTQGVFGVKKKLILCSNVHTHIIPLYNKHLELQPRVFEAPPMC